MRFKSEVAKHPELELRQNEDGWYLMDTAPHPEWTSFQINHEDWHWRVVSAFRRTADEAPKAREYLRLAMPAISGAILAWILVHTIAWIVAGFRAGDSGAPRPAG